MNLRVRCLSAEAGIALQKQHLRTCVMRADRCRDSRRSSAHYYNIISEIPFHPAFPILSNVSLHVPVYTILSIYAKRCNPETIGSTPFYLLIQLPMT
jgi:hypothetical protein